MSTTPKTIQIFLPGGSPTGIRVAEITTRIVQVIDVPRKLLSDFLEMPESNEVAVYFLVGESDDGTELNVYVGQTGDLRKRLAKHDADKPFWERALVLISRTKSLTQTHGLFLEWCSLQTIRKVKRYTDLNGNGGSRPHTPAPMEADCLEVFETARTLLATLGHPMFDPVAQAPQDTPPQDYLFCTVSGVDGRGLYTQEGFVVLAGSVGRKENMQSIAGTSNASFRDKLVANGTLSVNGDAVVFTKNHLFRSPSMAAVALLGTTANGWNVWKDKDGKTLDALKRQAIGT
ncbi:GIY-YIG nuclease family protein [Simplicispira piscis]